MTLCREKEHRFSKDKPIAVKLEAGTPWLRNSCRPWGSSLLVQAEASMRAVHSGHRG